MRDVVYEVTAHISGEELKNTYLDWLGSGHVQSVLEGGARHAMVTVYPEEGGWAVESRYVFSCQGEYDEYEATIAPRLRAESEKRFAPSGQVRFHRKVGQLAFRLP